MDTTTNALSVTITDVLSWEPCWDDDRIREVMASRERWTANDFADLYRSGKLGADEFLWVVLREQLIPAQTLHTLACDFAEAALLREREAGREPHADSWKAIETKRRWIKRKATNEELSEAEVAAEAVAVAAAEAATQAETQAAQAAAHAVRAAAESAARSAEVATTQAVRAAARSAVQAARTATQAAQAAAESAARSAEAATMQAAARNAEREAQAAHVIESHLTKGENAMGETDPKVKTIPSPEDYPKELWLLWNQKGYWIQAIDEGSLVAYTSKEDAEYGMGFHSDLYETKGLVPINILDRNKDRS